ncbi:unnamed protein product, partial [Prorocentrum cordatum]
MLLRRVLAGCLPACPTAGGHAALACSSDQQCFDVVALRLQRRHDRLNGVLRRLRWPRALHFEVDGVLHTLPVPSVHGGTQSQSDAMLSNHLAYLSGFFDGDGCVNVRSNAGSCSLSVSQSITQGCVLILFRSVLGGGIYYNSPGLGRRRPALQWRATGESGKWAAKQLSQYSRLKQGQLQIAAAWPKCSDLRALLARQLKAMKSAHYIPPNSEPCSWEYFAGFFDAEGYVKIPNHSASVHLRICQVNRHGLDSILGLLRKDSVGSWHLRHYPAAARPCHMLDCTDSHTSMNTLRQLLASGLMVKRNQAELALTLGPGSALPLREAMSRLSGNQGKGKRLDEHGAVRVKLIRKVRRKVRAQALRASLGEDDGEFSSLIQQVWRLQSQHAVGILSSQISDLRQDIRSLLAKGASLINRNTLPGEGPNPVQPRAAHGAALSSYTARRGTVRTEGVPLHCV